MPPKKVEDGTPGQRGLLPTRLPRLPPSTFLGPTSVVIRSREGPENVEDGTPGQRALCDLEADDRGI